MANACWSLYSFDFVAIVYFPVVIEWHRWFVLWFLCSNPNKEDISNNKTAWNKPMFMRATAVAVKSIWSQNVCVYLVEHTGKSDSLIIIYFRNFIKHFWNLGYFKFSIRIKLQYLINVDITISIHSPNHIGIFAVLDGFETLDKASQYLSQPNYILSSIIFSNIIMLIKYMNQIDVGKGH